MTYICMAKEGLRLSQAVSYPVGIVFALALFGYYLYIAFVRGKSKKVI